MLHSNRFAQVEKLAWTQCVCQILVQIDLTFRNVKGKAQEVEQSSQTPILCLAWRIFLKVPSNTNSKISIIMILNMGALFVHRTPLFQFSTFSHYPVITYINEMSFQMPLTYCLYANITACTVMDSDSFPLHLTLFFFRP